MTTSEPLSHDVTRRVACLDGLRGIASLWVLVGHTLMLTGWNVKILSEPDLGVDLFIMLSGFLMVFHYRIRSMKESRRSAGTWLKFWIRRYFRIAPLYYTLVTLAFVVGPAIHEQKMLIDQFLGHAVEPSPRYLDRGIANILLHFSFLFGLFPASAVRTALPDWSIGLEMQFYAVFPAVMVIVRWKGWLASAVLICGATTALALYLRYVGIEYSMPAFLPLKMQVFFCGMLLAGAVGAHGGRALGQWALALLLISIPVGGWFDIGRSVVRLGLVSTFFALVLYRLLPGILGRWAGLASEMLGTKVFYWLGELSFGCYLLHLFILQPVAATVIMHLGATISAPARFALVLSIELPLTYAIAYLTYRLIEGPGQRLGARTIMRLSGIPREPKQDATESIAAQ